MRAHRCEFFGNIFFYWARARAAFWLDISFLSFSVRVIVFARALSQIWKYFSPARAAVFFAGIIFPAFLGASSVSRRRHPNFREIGFLVAPARAAVFFGGYYFPGRFWPRHRFPAGVIANSGNRFFGCARACRRIFWRILFSRPFLGRVIVLARVFYSEARAALFFWRILFSRSFLGASSFSRGGQTVRQKAWWRGDAHSSTWARALVGTR